MTTLETRRLLLRQPSAADAAFITREIGNFNVSRNLARVPHPYTLEDAIDFLDWIKSYDERSLICTITLKQDPATSLGLISFEYDDTAGVAEFGYWLAEQYWGQGYGKEAAAAILHQAFATLKLPRLTAAFHNDNAASARILLGAGFEEIGKAPHYSKAQDREVPSTQLQLTRQRWQRLHGL